MKEKVEQFLDSIGVKRINDNSQVINLMTYEQAKEKANLLDQEAKKFWDNFGGVYASRDKIREENPSAPADGYYVSRNIYGAQQCGDIVYLTMPGVLAGDGRIRDKDGDLFQVPQEDLDSAIWSVRESYWSDW